MAPEPGTPAEWQAIIGSFLVQHVRQAGAQGVVIGISGGIDSAVTAALCVEALGAKQVLGLVMPHADSDPEDERLGRLVCDHLGIAFERRDITGIVAGAVGSGAGLDDPALQGNMKARARMMLLYAEAQARGRLVCGTGNKSELLVGYFTKWGDGGADLEPIGDLYKTQVWALARHLGMPKEVVERAPTAGLRPGQTDEQELGMRYADLDATLACFERNLGAEETAQNTGLGLERVRHVERLVRRSEHKRHMPLVPKIGLRTVGIDWRRPVHWDG